MTTFGMTAPTVMKEPEADAGSLFVMKDGVLVLNTKAARQLSRQDSMDRDRSGVDEY